MLFKTLLLATLSTVCLAVEFQIVNRELADIWVGIQAIPGHAHLSEGGFVLQPGKRVSIRASANWTGRFWARTWCDPKSEHCATGDCGNVLKCNGAGPGVSSAEITIKGHGGLDYDDDSLVEFGAPSASLAEITVNGYGGLDYYDISLVYGFNVMVAIEPLGGSGDGDRYSCKKAACQVRLNDVCPERLKVRNSHGVIACNSACNAFNTDQYCCRGAFGTADKCKASTWPQNYPQFFKKHCPDAYSSAYDDYKSTFTCKAEAYLVTFGG